MKQAVVYICLGRHRHEVTALSWCKKHPTKCPACRAGLEKYDGRRHKVRAA